MAAAFGAMEQSDVSVRSLSSMGISTDSGVRLRDCGSGKEAATARREIAAKLIELKPTTCARLSSLSTGDTAHASDVLRKVEVLVAAVMDEVLQHAAAGRAGAKSASPTKETVHVLLEKEEDRAYSNPKYSNADVTSQIELVWSMYNHVVRSKMMPKLGLCKRICYHVKEAATWPDPDRIKLEEYRRDPTDRPLTLFEREVWGVCTIACGEVVPAGKRDNGAGDFEGFEPQWASVNVAMALLGEINEKRDATADNVMRNALKQMRAALFSATDLGRESASLAMQGQISRVKEYIVLRQECGNTPVKEKKAPSTPKTQKTTRTQAPKKRGKKRGAAEA